MYFHVFYNIHYGLNVNESHSPHSIRQIWQAGRQSQTSEATIVDQSHGWAGGWGPGQPAGHREVVLTWDTSAGTAEASGEACGPLRGKAGAEG